MIAVFSEPVSLQKVFDDVIWDGGLFRHRKCFKLYTTYIQLGITREREQAVNQTLSFNVRFRSLGRQERKHVNADDPTSLPENPLAVISLQAKRSCHFCKHFMSVCPHTSIHPSLFNGVGWTQLLGWFRLISYGRYWALIAPFLF